MEKKYKKMAIKWTSLLTLLSVGILSGCQGNSNLAQIGEESSNAETTKESAVSTADYDLEFSSDDLEVGYDEANLTTIQLDDDNSTGDSENVTVEGNNINISAGGTYLVSGELSDGQIKVSAPDTEEVHLLLDGVDITSVNSAPLLIEEAEKVFITLTEGSQNFLSDQAGSTATIGTGTDTVNIDGTIFSKADLTLNGSGSLTIDANTKHGIVSKDDLIVVSGTYDITSEGQGLSGKDAVKIKEGVFTLNTGTDGIQSDNAEETGKGFVYIGGGTFDINSQQDAVQAETLIQIDGGIIEITAGGGTENAVSKSSEFGGFFGQKELETENEDDNADAEDSASTSMKGLKSAGEIIVNAGEIIIDAADDSIHSDGNLTLTGGTLTLASGDDGLHSGENLQLTGAVVAVTESYEGIEGKMITITDGEVSVVATDDGLNASSGSTNSTTKDAGGEFASNSENVLLISGGTLTVNSSGDGLDSNGIIKISGGTTTLSGPENDGNGTIDSNGEAVISDGTIVGSGSSGMAESFSESSTQASVLYGLESAYEAGSEIQVMDSEGTVLLSWTADKSFTSIQFSSADIVVEETYTISIDGEKSEITVDSIATSTGVMTSGGMGGGMQQPSSGEKRDDKPF